MDGGGAPRESSGSQAAAEARRQAEAAEERALTAAVLCAMPNTMLPLRSVQGGEVPPCEAACHSYHGVQRDTAAQREVLADGRAPHSPTAQLSPPHEMNARLPPLPPLLRSALDCRTMHCRRCRRSCTRRARCSLHKVGVHHELPPQPPRLNGGAIGSVEHKAARTKRPHRCSGSMGPWWCSAEPRAAHKSASWLVGAQQLRQSLISLFVQSHFFGSFSPRSVLLPKLRVAGL